MDKTLTLAEKLVHAIQEDIISKAKELLELGANPNQILPTGISAFHLAIGTDTVNALAFVRLLLQYNANPNVRSVDGMTPVHIAATWGRYQALHLLLLNGGNPELCDEDGSNALDMAMENENWECLSLMTTYLHQTEEGCQFVTRDSCYSHSECSSTCHNSTDLNQNSVSATLDSTGLAAYFQDDSISCLPSSPCSSKDKETLTSFFPDISLKNDSGGKCASSKLKTRRRTFSFPAKQCRMNFELQNEVQECDTRTMSESNQKVEIGIGESANSENGHDGEDETEECDKAGGNRTLTSKYLEEVLLNNSCTGIDLTSPDHPAIFIKHQRCGDSPSLDKTLSHVPCRRSVSQPTETRQVNGCDTQSLGDPNSCEENLTYVTCQSDDMMLCCTDIRLPSNKQLTPQRRVTLSDECDGSTNSLFHQSCQTQVTDTCSKHVSERYEKGTCNNFPTRDSSVKSSEKTFVIMDKLILDASDLITSDEDSFLTCEAPKTSQQENGRRQMFDCNGSTEVLKELEIEKSLASHTCSHPLSKLLEIQCDDSNIAHDSVDYLLHDQDTGAMLIERHCPSACSTNTTHEDVSGLDYSYVSTMEETVLYDWRDYHTNEDDDDGTSSPPTLCEKLLQLSNKEIRELMQKYGEEAGPITATTRMVYLHHLAKLQNDPEFASRAANRQQTSHGFRWELAEYLNTGQMAETDLKMAADEQLMVAPFQIPDPMRKWREGTLKSSFNYLLLDPRVTKDLPGRYTQLTQLETFQVFVAAIFYIGKGKRGRPYAHFYEALSTIKPCKEKEGPTVTPKKAYKKQPGAKVRHILDIWAAGLGVVSLHCFQSVIPVEAYTREACMVDAMGLARLTNVKKGDFYGPSASLPVRKRRQMGVYLLKKACQIFLVEGERQIRPVDIALGQ